MNELIEKLRQPDFPVLFNFNNLKNLKINNNFKKLFEESINNKWINKIYKDLYTLSYDYCKSYVSLEVIAQMIVPESYISSAYVLSINNWIPERVYFITSIAKNIDMDIDTNEYMSYSYTKLYKNYISYGITEKENECGKYKIAKPLRALCDYILKRNDDCSCFEYFTDYMRIDFDKFEKLTCNDFDELQGKFNIKKIENMLENIRKELKL